MRNIEKFFDKDNLDLTLLDKIEILIRNANELKYVGYEKDIEYLNYLKINYGKLLINANLRKSVEKILIEMLEFMLEKMSSEHSLSPVRKR